MELTTKELFEIYEACGIAFICEDGKVERAIVED